MMAKKTMKRTGTSGLYKLSNEQKEKILKAYEMNDTETITQIEALVSRRALFELTHRPEYRPKNNRAWRNKDLDTLLFSY